MEYVGGQSLKELRAAGPETGVLRPLPLGQAIAYALEVLPALGYLHAQGLLYCDFKPDNVIQTEEQLTLIDLGAVRRMDDEDSALYKTDGYCAPELSADGPSVESDLYTVARTLAVLTFNFDYTRTFADTLPGPADIPVLAQHPSYHRLLLRATDPDPDRRFASAQEMADQLTGVLREALSTMDGQARPGLSTLFSPERTVFAAGPDDWSTPPDAAAVAAALPVPLVDRADPAAGFLAGVAALDPTRLLAALATAPAHTAEVRLKLAHALIETGDLDGARTELAALDADEPGDWRVLWYHGLAALSAGAPKQAAAHFDAVYTMLPGEAAPKLAVAVARELHDDRVGAAAAYRLVWRTDQSYLSAAFGLARVLLAAGSRADAVTALDSVPATSSHFVIAQAAGIRTRAAGCARQELPDAELFTAADQLDGLDLDPARTSALTVELLRAAHSRVGAGPEDPARTILGSRFTDAELRTALEQSYRTMARLADTRARRVELVELANAVRPLTWV